MFGNGSTDTGLPPTVDRLPADTGTPGARPARLTHDGRCRSAPMRRRSTPARPAGVVEVQEWPMSAVDDLSELVERAGAAERAALASKWKDRPDVDALRRKVRRVLDEHRAAERRSGGNGSEPRRE